MLQTILLTQIMLETLNGLSGPKAPQGNTITYHMIPRVPSITDSRLRVIDFIWPILARFGPISISLLGNNRTVGVVLSF